MSVCTAVSPNDQMFNKVHGYGVYHAIGRSALECIRYSLVSARKRPSDVKRILDLPSGHGRVLRHLRAAFPRAEITACDLLPDAVDFCMSTFGAIPAYSHEDPARINLPRDRFDLIWVGSLLTHLDRAQWGGFLSFFESCLHSGGLLVFTTHGREAHSRMLTGTFDYLLDDSARKSVLAEYESCRFGYAKYAWSACYGVSISHPAWVFEELSLITNLQVTHFAEDAWVGFQDVFSCVRRPEKTAGKPGMKSPRG
jgi:SAM-dependent methyltransferase